MKITTFVFLLMITTPLMGENSMSERFSINTSSALQTAKFVVHSPDDEVPTLGEVSFIMDLAAEHDNLLALSIRRAGLTLADGRKTKTFSYNKEARIIVAGAGDVSHVSLASVENKSAGRQLLVLFHNDRNEVIAPAATDIAVFDLNHQHLPFHYKPSFQPQSRSLPVDLLLDHSGSMSAVMRDVQQASEQFLAALPGFTRCGVLAFASDIRRLTPSDVGQMTNCPKSATVLQQPIMARGSTALFSALASAFTSNIASVGTVPKVVIAVTDGVNTVSTAHTTQSLIDLKSKSNAKVFVFWAGSHDPAHLKGIADVEITRQRDMKLELDRFYQTLGVSISGMQTLTIPLAGHP